MSERFQHIGRERYASRAQRKKRRQFRREPSSKLPCIRPLIWVPLLLSWLALSQFVGCASAPPRAEPQVFYYQLKMPSPNRIRYTGQGVGAGMMLSASMGPMGVAVGVAMDEGEARKLQQAFAQDGYVMESVISEALQVGALAGGVSLLPHSDAINGNSAELIIHVERYGFRTVGGNSDLVQPFMRGYSIYQGQKNVIDITFEHPEQIHALEHLQTNGALIAEVFTELTQQWRVENTAPLSLIPTESTNYGR